jgi:hypothetical protein
MQRSAGTQASAALLGALLTVVVCAGHAFADSAGIWGELAVPVFQSNRLQWSAAAEFRSDEAFPRNTFIGRYNTTARVFLPHGYSVRVTYLSFLRSGNDFTGVGWHKAIGGGVSYLLWTPKLMGSTIYEHHWLTGSGGERDRVRQRFEFSWPRKPATPWGYQDLTLENGRGFYRSITRAGLSFVLPKGWQVRTGYEFRTFQRSGSTAWTPHHALLLQLRLPTLFDRREKQKFAQEPASQREEVTDDVQHE